MNKILAFFNKIMGLMVFLLVVLLALSFMRHGHHRHGWHHRQMKDGSYKKEKDSLGTITVDTAIRK